MNYLEIYNNIITRAKQMQPVNCYTEKHPLFGSVVSQATKNKIGNAEKEQYKTGRIVWNKGKKGVQVAWNKGKSSWSKGKKLSEEHKQNIRKSVKGKPKTEAHNRKNKEAHTGLKYKIKEGI